MTVENPTAAPIEEPVRDPLAGPGGGGAALFAAIFELIASNGAEKTGPVQCTDNNDTLIHWNTTSGAYQFGIVGSPRYRIPLDGGVASSAPDSEEAAVRCALSNNPTSNANAAENLDPLSFTIGCRYWQESSGVFARVHGAFFGGLNFGHTVTYDTGGANTLKLILRHAGGPTTLTLNGVPENAVSTWVFRYDGVTAFFAVYGEDGTTLIDSASLVVTLTFVDDVVTLSSGQHRVKRLPAGGFIEGDALTNFLETLLTDNPFPAA